MRQRRRVILYVLLAILEVFDFFSDWMFFAEMKTAKKGLVYGPPEKAALWSLLVFAILGLWFIFDLLNLWRDKFSDKEPWVDTTLLSAIILWFEDVPQIIISFSIAYCREDPSSVFQLIKASLVFVDLAIHICVACYDYCKDRMKSKLQKICWGFIALGMLINTCFAIVVFIFTQAHRDSNNDIKVHQPKSLFKDTYNNQRYFQNVSVFFHLPDFAASTPSQSTGSEWVRLTSINDILNLDNAGVMNFNLVHEKTNAHVKMALYKENKAGNNQKGDWQLSGCYQMELATRAMISVNESTCRGASFFSNNRTSVFIGFSFTAPDSIVFRERIFGEIYYNIKVFNNGQCTDLTTPPAIHYYRVNATISDNNAKDLLMGGGTPRFYRSDTNDLQDVREVWKTGFYQQCKSSGSLAPVLDSGITVECSNTGV
ncbi:uncharacterized protein [Littorina saxatilis]|uniref:Uncharacterized protein n=1 Tax=Littorina saxatilis TaxID=31220 RepID=A0AAN9FYV4_9CAEN